MTLCFVVTLLTSGAVWMIGSDRILAVAAYDGAFPGFFGVFNRTFGTPVRVNTMSGIFATIFMVVAVASFHGGADAKFVVVLTIAISTTLISYLWIFPSALKLRYSHPHVRRPYSVPGGLRGMWIAAVLTTFWIALGSFVAVFPGTLEGLFGLDYDFKETWGVSHATYEALTLGTLGGHPRHRAHRLRAGPVRARARGGAAAGGRRPRAHAGGHHLERGEERLELGDDVAVELDGRAVVPRRRALRDDRDGAAGGARDARQLGDRVDLERGADAEQHVGARGQRVGALQRVLGQPLAEQHDVGLQRLAAVAARARQSGRRARRARDLGRAGSARRRPGTTRSRCCRGPRRARACPPCGAACRCSA